MNRCPICNKKLGITAIVCRCNNSYCVKHRYAEDHDCKYDYKTEERKSLLHSLTKYKQSMVNNNEKGYGGVC